MAEKVEEDFFKSRSLEFGSFAPADEFLHPHIACHGDTCTETQYFGFYVPEARVYAFAYLWVHPNLQTVFGGLVVCEGFKRHHLQAELFDFRANLSRSSALPEDLRSFRLPNSYQVDVLEPGKRMRLRYSDPRRENELDIEATAAGPVAMRANQKHFEQAMHYRGSLTLRGKSYAVDCHNVRDRSWGEPRPEDPLPFPPLTWTTGCFGESFAFNCSAFDHPDYNPETKADFPISASQAFNDGWVFCDGELVKIKAIKKLTTRDSRTGRPVSHVIEALDVMNRSFHITGTVVAGLPLSCWPNCVTHLGLTRWEYDGRVGWGDTQEVQWTDYMRSFTDDEDGVARS